MMIAESDGQGPQLRELPMHEPARHRERPHRPRRRRGGNRAHLRLRAHPRRDAGGVAERRREQPSIAKSQDFQAKRATGEPELEL